MSVFEDFFRELDASWKWPADAKTSLRIIGSAALMLQADYERGTKDTDVGKDCFLGEQDDVVGVVVVVVFPVFCASGNDDDDDGPPVRPAVAVDAHV